MKRLRVLPWDSRFFGLRIGQLEAVRLTSSVAQDAIAWSQKNEIRCLYYLAEKQDAATRRTAALNQFKPQCLRLTYERRTERRAIAPAVPIRPARPADFAALRATLPAAAAGSRFRKDRHFPKNSGSKLYTLWLQRSIQGQFDEVVLAAFLNKRPVGLISLKRLSKSIGQIGLLSVAARAQRRGIGRALVEAGLDWLAQRGVAKVRVATHGEHELAQKLYEGTGFRRVSCAVWYHRWFPHT